MEWIFFMVIIIYLIDINSKISKMQNNNTNNKSINKSKFIIENYIGKKVNIEIDNEDINDSHLFSSVYNTIGEIVECDDEWFLFRYYDKSKKQTINQYMRIRDITSINEIKSNQ